MYLCMDTLKECGPYDEECSKLEIIDKDVGGWQSLPCDTYREASSNARQKSLINKILIKRTID
jgi:hypothetical protein